MEEDVVPQEEARFRVVDAGCECAIKEGDEHWLCREGRCGPGAVLREVLPDI